MTDQIKQYRILVSGIVQGVFFRKYTYEKANELKLSGWVKNLPNGNVELLIKGSKQSCDRWPPLLKSN